DLLVGARVGDLAVPLEAHHGQGGVLLLLEPPADVLVDDGVDGGDQVQGLDVGIRLDHRGDGALEHHRDQAGGQPVPGHVAHADPAAARVGDDVEVVPSHLGGGHHVGGDVQAPHGDRVGQQRDLDPGGDLHL